MMNLGLFYLLFWLMIGGCSSTYIINRKYSLIIIISLPSSSSLLFFFYLVLQGSVFNFHCHAYIVTSAKEGVFDQIFISFFKYGMVVMVEVYKGH